MGQSTNGMLAYGYNLGGAEGWNLEGLDEYGELPELPWLDEEEHDFQEAAERHLLVEIAGFTEGWSSGNEGYFDRERQAKQRLGVQFDTHCSGDYPMFLLATKVITVYRGDAKELDLAALQQEAQASDWDTKLAAAVHVLGITPTATKPQWLLCSYWG